MTAVLLTCLLLVLQFYNLAMFLDELVSLACVKYL